MVAKKRRTNPVTIISDYTAQKVDEMLAAPSASADTKKSAQAWKDAIAAGKDADAATNTLLDAISAHQTTIDSLIGFMSSDKAKELFGADVAARNVAHAEERKAKGRQVVRLRSLQALP